MIAERNAAALAKSPFCVALLYCLQTTNNVFLVMEYMIGGDLKSLLGVYGFFPEHQVIESLCIHHTTLSRLCST